MPTNEETPLYPLFLKVKGLTVLVVGAGSIAERKIANLLECDARVRVVAPEATAKIRQWADEGTIEWLEREFAERDAAGAWLAIAATSDGSVQRRVAAACEAKRLFVVAADDPGNASAYSGAVVRRPPFTVAISSSGATPALTRLVREIIEQTLPSDDWIAHAQRLRAKWIAESTPVGERFAQLVHEFAARTQKRAD